MADFLGEVAEGLTRTIAFAKGRGANITAMSGNVTLTMASPNFMALDPAGNRDLTMPDTKGKGWFCVVLNTADAAETITYKDPAGNTICAGAQNTAAIVFTDGTTWDGFKFTISLS